MIFFCLVQCSVLCQSNPRYVLVCIVYALLSFDGRVLFHWVVLVYYMSCCYWTHISSLQILSLKIYMYRYKGSAGSTVIIFDAANITRKGTLRRGNVVSARSFT